MTHKAKYTLQLATLSLLSLGVLTGCNTIKNLTDKKDDLTLTATSTDAQYYQNATAAIEKKQYSQAKLHLNDLRTFYPTSRYAEQALLDLIYVYHESKDYEAVATSATQFINSYPTSSHLDYAVYARGVTYMHGSPKAGRIFKLDQSERDTAFLRLAFADFQTLVTRFPNSIYAPDAALRMTDIYNQFAHHELQAARWYIKRDAHVAAANRAKWVFQYYPQSTAVPEAIAILAYSNDKLGLASTANQYKTLLQINYPQYLNGNKVILPNQSHSWGKKTLSMITLGRFGSDKALGTQNQAHNYDGETQTQVIKQATALRLPETSNQNQAAPDFEFKQRTPRLGLSLPEDEAVAGNQTSPTTLANEAIIESSNAPILRQNTSNP